MDFNTRLLQVTSKAAVMECRLCLARGQELRIYKVQPSTASRTGQLLCPLVKIIRVEEPLIQLQWIDDHHLLAMDSKEVLQLIDPTRGRVVAERESGSAAGIVYNSADYKALSTGGNVSEALAALADQVCYQSMCRMMLDEGGGGMVYLLGQQGLHRVELMDQLAQMETFIAKCVS